jgi:hypothetical protein
MADYGSSSSGQGGRATQLMKARQESREALEREKAQIEKVCVGVCAASRHSLVFSSPFCCACFSSSGIELLSVSDSAEHQLMAVACVGCLYVVWYPATAHSG